MAAKRARLRRFCERKPSGKLQCPQWLHEQWKGNTNRDELLEQFEKCGWDKEKFVKEITVIHERRNKASLQTEKGWYSKSEMRDTLSWDETRIEGAVKKCRANGATFVRKNQYDGVDEFWVDVRTTGTAAYEETDVEKSKQRSYAESDDPMEGPNKPGNMDALFADTPGAEPATQTGADKEKDLKSFMQSVLQKTSKLHQLSGELQKNFDDPKATQAVKDLAEKCNALENEYDTLMHVKTKGDLQGYVGLEGEIDKKIESATYTCSKGLALEVKIRGAKASWNKKPGQTTLGSNKRPAADPSAPAKKPKKKAKAKSAGSRKAKQE